MLPAQRVLLWNGDQDGSFGGYGQLESVLDDFGIVWKDFATWSHNLDDYGLIIWMMATGDPSWWASITGATWTGRLHISGEFDSGVPPVGFPATNAYVNSKSGLHGMTIATNLSGGFFCPDPSQPTHGESNAASALDLTDGMSELWGNATASVSGGSTLFTNPHLSLPMMQRNKVGGIDWVVSGDSTHIDGNCSLVAGMNKKFFCNLWRKALP